MDLTAITPTILTRNESANIVDTLQRVTWAERVVVIDSFSDDSTVELCSQFSNVTVKQRKFDCHANQANFALAHVNTEWALSMDADYKVSTDFVASINAIQNVDGINGYSIPFRYAIHGKLLRGTLYPPRVSLYRAARASYVQDGHTQRVCVQGQIGNFPTPLIHDDRKPLASWLQSQLRYARLEVEKLNSLTGESGWKDWLRKKTYLAPVLTIPYCLLRQGLILDGKAGIYYTLQRAFAELLLLIELQDLRLKDLSSEPSTVANAKP